MQLQKLQSLALFIVLVIFIFFVAHRFMREITVSFDSQENRSGHFLELVETLNGIQLDSELISSGVAGAIVISPVEVEPPTRGIGRDNPFSVIFRPPEVPEGTVFVEESAPPAESFEEPVGEEYGDPTVNSDPAGEDVGAVLIR